MSNDIIDIFSGLPITESCPPLPKPPQPKRPYKAYEMGSGAQHSLMVTNSFGNVKLFSYAYLSEVLFRPTYQHLDLFYHNKGPGMVMTIWGPHLEALLEPLQDRKLRAVCSFNKSIYLRPEEGDPIITDVRTSSLKSYYERVARETGQPAG